VLGALVAKRNQFRLEKEVKKLSRERLGPVRPGQTIEPRKQRRRSAKHPKKERESWGE
jgi:hypothetical protein